MKIAVITGASSGIGREFARQLDSANLDELWIIARRKERLEQLAAELRTPARVIQLDLGDRRAIEHVEKLLRKHAPTVMWLINSAGFGKVGNFDELPRETILGMIDVNIRALTHLTHIAIPYMTRGSHIVQVASSAGYQPLGCFAVYAASKAYVISLSYALAAELRLKGIHTMVMAPGPVRTEFSSVSREDPTWHKAMLTKESDVRAVVAEALCDARKRKWASLYGFSNKLVPLLAALSPRRLMAIVSRTFIYVKVRRKD